MMIALCKFRTTLNRVHTRRFKLQAREKHDHGHSSLKPEKQPGPKIFPDMSALVDATMSVADIMIL
jgi:hypothetical protein